MSEKSYDSNKDDDEIPTKALLKFVSNVSGPLTHVEDVKLPKPLSPISPTSHSKKPLSRRGPKSTGDWTREIRKAWGNLYDVDELEKVGLPNYRL